MSKNAPSRSETVLITRLARANFSFQADFKREIRWSELYEVVIGTKYRRFGEHASTGHADPLTRNGKVFGFFFVFSSAQAHSRNSARVEFSA